MPQGSLGGESSFKSYFESRKYTWFNFLATLGSFFYCFKACYIVALAVVLAKLLEPPYSLDLALSSDDKELKLMPFGLFFLAMVVMAPELFLFSSARPREDFLVTLVLTVLKSMVCFARAMVILFLLAITISKVMVLLYNF